MHTHKFVLCIHTPPAHELDGLGLPPGCALWQPCWRVIVIILVLVIAAAAAAPPHLPAHGRRYNVRRRRLARGHREHRVCTWGEHRRGKYMEDGSVGGLLCCVLFPRAVLGTSVRVGLLPADGAVYASSQRTSWRSTHLYVIGVWARFHRGSWRPCARGAASPVPRQTHHQSAGGESQPVRMPNEQTWEGIDPQNACKRVIYLCSKLGGTEPEHVPCHMRQPDAPKGVCSFQTSSLKGRCPPIASWHSY